MRLVDTNVLLYAASPAPDDAAKHGLAVALLKQPDLALSVQVLAEFFVQATRPSRPHALSAELALRFLSVFDDFPVQPITAEVFRAGVSLSQRFGLSYWDGAILAAAQALGCDVVYSEDISAQPDYDGLRVINPFVEQ